MINKIILPVPLVNKKEILRYCQSESHDVITVNLIDECLKELENKLNFAVCYKILNINDDFFKSLKTSKTLNKALENCSSAIVFAATIGPYLDRLILKYSKISPVKALVMQAIGSERIESLCNSFCEYFNNKLKSSNKSLKQRVSAGYGDIPLNKQEEIFLLLDCPKNIGLTLTSKLIMVPSKSVTAIAGIKSQNTN